MSNALKMALLTVGATLFYAYVGQMVPQKEVYPPESLELNTDMTTEEMVAAGKTIVEGKGTCISCHTIGQNPEGARFPDLGGVGARAATRKEGYSDVDYLAESLYEPNAYIVDGFNPGMISASKPPVSLTEPEILCVIAYLQSLGGTPTVTMQTQTKYSGQAPGPGAIAASGSAPAARANLTGSELVTNYGCVTCHSFDAPAKMLGPSLYDVGDRLAPAQIYESIMDPDAKVAEGFDSGLMLTTLNAMQFYQKVNATELKTIVDYLSSLKGSE